ncbi:MAG: HD domain-containing protein [Spirochaetia bacterium]|nr:HD domain-containing protein [Spirochaetota bacterium]MCX8097292.1 HD domain-containing protein [Spirochaetota bacterium]MDW8112569.1 HD domain-containing protein [Spirochaetia bacterium]
MEVEKITFYLFASIVSGTLTYLLIMTILSVKIKAKRMKIISANAIIASIIYLIGSILIYLLRTSEIVYIIYGLVYVGKFITETNMSNKLHYSQRNYTFYHITTSLLVLAALAIQLLGLGNVIIYVVILSLVNIMISIAWFSEKNVRILSFSNIISIVFLITLMDYPSTSLLFSLLPLGLSSIYITSKEYLHTLRSLDLLKEKKDAIIEHQLKEFKDFLFLLINKIEARYPLRKQHSINVVTISEGIAIELGLDGKVVSFIREGAMMHDIGFLGVDHRNLLEGSSYENPEVMKHIWIGRRILESSNIFIKYLPMVLYHHERMDGSGPEGLYGSIIPLPAKIVAVADKFERLINGRESEKLSIQDAIEYLKKHPNLYDQVVVKALESFVSKNFFQQH